jgi:hypothetical protein
MRNLLIAVPLFASLLACTAAKAPPADDFSAYAGGGGKADAFAVVVADLAYGDRVVVDYTPVPRYRAVRFEGTQGDQVEIFVASEDGDPVVWLLDGALQLVAFNDDAGDDTTDAIGEAYNALVVAGTLATFTVQADTLPASPRALHEKWVMDLPNTPGMVVSAYVITVGEQSATIVRRYGAGIGLELAAFSDSGLLLGVAGGTGEQIDQWSGL